MLPILTEFSQEPEAATVQKIPGGYLHVSLLDNIKQLDSTEDEALRWSADLYTLTVLDLPGIARRILENPAAWLQQAKED